MNFCVCRNCNACKYRGKNNWDPYCAAEGCGDKNIHEVTKCPLGYLNRDEFGEVILDK